MLERRLVGIEGTVQGVGFRPFVHGLATALGLRGFVRNAAGRVLVEVEGDPPALDEFLHALDTELPAPAAIARMRVRSTPPRGDREFRIEGSVHSQRRGGGDVQHALSGAHVIAPDLATCEQCVAELFDPTDRRFRYPFISCSRCGPRLSILLATPYDRARTTMGAFAMCADCRREYDDPHDRRFHAQTNACAACGPQVAFISLPHSASDAGAGSAPLRGERAIAAAADALRRGAIVAVKGVGGYHLACDATSPEAVRRLRERKQRDGRPFAVMVSDDGMAAQVAEYTRAERELMASAARPIVLVRRGHANGHAPHHGASHRPADDVAPGSPWLGLMLPYTPLHHLLLRDAGRPLVMTSGNRSEEPIVWVDDEAVARLGGIADCILGHDRAIATPCDDSVVRVIGGAAAPMRRSRGMLPDPITLPVRGHRPVLALGGHLKSTICLAAGGRAELSPHIGDLDHALAVAALRRSVVHHTAMLEVVPEVIAHDLHPDYASTRLALAIASGEDALLADPHGVQCVAVQHHHAHVASCMAEHGISEPVLGVAFDGTGLGSDGAVWGGEFLLVDGATFTRAAHLRYVPLPGGDAAAREPWRMAVAHLWSAFGGEAELERIAPATLCLERRAEWPLLRQMLERGVRTPPTSSAGRLFDAVAALTGVRTTSRFEGDAAVALESIADATSRRVYPVGAQDVNGTCVLDTAPLIHGVLADVAAGHEPAQVAGAFHESLAHMIASVARRMREQASGAFRHVALTGGVFQNALLTGRAAALLERDGFHVLRHLRVPCNDGGLALGQALVAALRNQSVPAAAALVMQHHEAPALEV